MYTRQWKNFWTSLWSCRNIEQNFIYLWINYINNSFHINSAAIFSMPKNSVFQCILMLMAFWSQTLLKRTWTPLGLDSGLGDSTTLLVGRQTRGGKSDMKEADQLWCNRYFYNKPGAQWLRSKFGALCLEDRRFESHSSRHIGTLGKSFIHSCVFIFVYCQKQRLSNRNSLTGNSQIKNNLKKNRQCGYVRDL